MYLQFEFNGMECKEEDNHEEEAGKITFHGSETLRHANVRIDIP